MTPIFKNCRYTLKALPNSDMESSSATVTLKCAAKEAVEIEAGYSGLINGELILYFNGREMWRVKYGRISAHTAHVHARSVCQLVA